jgi:hypothetical protein
VRKNIQYHWDLDVYEMSVNAATQIFEISKKFPKEEIVSFNAFKGSEVQGSPKI